MKVNMAKELAALDRLTVTQLREKHIEVFGEATRSGNKDWLRKRIAWRMQASGTRSARLDHRRGAGLAQAVRALEVPEGRPAGRASHQRRVIQPQFAGRPLAPAGAACRMTRQCAGLRRRIHLVHERVASHLSEALRMVRW
jgi:hypothetical protein